MGLFLLLPCWVGTRSVMLSLCLQSPCLLLLLTEPFTYSLFCFVLTSRVFLLISFSSPRKSW